MKSIITILFFISPLLFSGNCIFAQIGETHWKLIWEDHFEGVELDSTKWSLISTQPDQYDRVPSPSILS